MAKADVASESDSSDSDIGLANSKGQGNYDKACDDYQETEVDRTNNLNNM